MVFYRGASLNSRLSQVTLGKSFSLNQATQTLKVLNDPTSSSFNSATCTCNSVLASADYTVTYIRRDNGYYWIDKIIADLTLYDSVSLDASYCNGQAKQPALVPQSFSVKYQTTTQGNVNTFYRSGNPGYIMGMPVLVSETDKGSTKKVN